MNKKDSPKLYKSASLSFIDLPTKRSSSKRILSNVSVEYLDKDSFYEEVFDHVYPGILSDSKLLAEIAKQVQKGKTEQQVLNEFIIELNKDEFNTLLELIALKESELESISDETLAQLYQEDIAKLLTLKRRFIEWFRDKGSHDWAKKLLLQHSNKHRSKSKMKRKTGVLARFPSPNDLTWDEITISFVSDESVKIEARNIRERYMFAEMGFKDNRKGDLPNQLWYLLRGMAQTNGEIPDKTPDLLDLDNRKKTEKAINRIRKILREFFSIDGDPIPWYRSTNEGKRYATKFLLKDKRPTTESKKQDDIDNYKKYHGKLLKSTGDSSLLDQTNGGSSEEDSLPFEPYIDPETGEYITGPDE